MGSDRRHDDNSREVQRARGIGLRTPGPPDFKTSPPQGPPRSDGPSVRSVLPSLVIDGLLPFLTYVLLTSYVPRLSQFVVLGLSAVFPTVNGLVTIVRRRHLDIIGAVVLDVVMCSGKKQHGRQCPVARNKRHGVPAIVT
jgi:hypothetical protein